MTTYSERLALHAMDLDAEGRHSAADYAVGNMTVATESFRLQYKRLSIVGIGRRWWLLGTFRATLAGTTRTIVTDAPERVTLQGTGRVLLSELGTVTDTLYLGSPKVPSRSFTVPTDYFLDQMIRLTLVDAMRVTLLGTADLIVNDDFRTRSRVVLAGQG